MDVVLCETGDGGDFLYLNGDVKLTGGLSTQIYLSLFGGNIGTDESDRGEFARGQERSDWWGNSILFDGEDSKKFVSETETKLRQVVLNSSGRIEIENAVKNDLAHLSDIGTVTVSVTVSGINRLDINILVQELGSNENQFFQYIWDAQKNEASCLCDGYVVKGDISQDGDFDLADFSGLDFQI